MMTVSTVRRASAAPRCQHQVERFGGRDENVGGMAAETGAFALGRITGADTDEGLVKWNASAAGHVGYTGERRAEVALHIDGESFEGRHVNDLAASFSSFRPRVEHQAVEAPEECGKGFACSGWSKDEGALAACDDRPAQALRGRRRVKDRMKPFSCDGVETSERVASLPVESQNRWLGKLRFGIGMGRPWGHACSKHNAA